ncbi:MAG TPA: tRNA (adenosine(37)-N6)-threonylcarbamoyltransferase complex dimerization subunit type 1 TsaB, partial [Solibacterales bacterium]|nr:tRNA (adenosine(37)-N6)-threonylcarbamoyltransferase complex dimerization subunit type 1 TsaB [Bryobacterales bacterium]
MLAVDTTAEFGSIAIAEDGRVIEVVPLHSPEGFGQVLFGEVERLLARRGWAAGEIDCFAAAAGPGSFTGVRVGLAAAKGLAEAAGKRAAAISNLRAMASFGAGPLRAPILDARRGEVYAGLFDAHLREAGP